MHILFLPKWFPNKFDVTNGVFIENLAKKLSKSQTVTIIAIHPDTENTVSLSFSEKKEDYSLLQVYYRSVNSNSLYYRSYNLFQWLRAFRLAWKYFRKNYHKPDIIHVHVLTRPAIMAFVVKKIIGTPYLITEHWSRYIRPEYSEKSSFYKKITQVAVKNASALIAVSQSLKQSLAQNNLMHSQMLVIPNMVDIKTVNTALPSVKKNGGTILIATVSDLVEKTKNIRSVLQVFANVVKVFPNIEYHLVGDGPDTDNYKELTTKLQLTEKVIFHGRQSHDYVCNFLPNIDILITNSFSETFSVATAEALAYGKPVIATRCGGPESFVNESNGILIDTDSPRQLEDAMLYMIKNYRNYPAETVKESVLQFLPDAIIEKYLILYNKILSNN